MEKRKIKKEKQIKSNKFVTVLTSYKKLYHVLYDFWTKIKVIKEKREEFYDKQIYVSWFIFRGKLKNRVEHGVGCYYDLAEEFLFEKKGNVDRMKSLNIVNAFDPSNSCAFIAHEKKRGRWMRST